MGSFHWLHFSDLHLTPKISFKPYYARSQLLKFLDRETTAGRLPCDYIFITGDIANQGNYDGVPRFIEQLFKSLEWSDYKRVFWAVGNHDISRTSLLRKLVIKRIREGEYDSELFENLMFDPEIREVLIQKVMKEYHRWHKEILTEATKGNFSDPHNKYLLPDLNLVVLNTCLTSCDDSDEHNLCIQDCSLHEVFEGLDRSKPTFVMGHHGMEFFKHSERRAMAHLFDSSSVDLYLCGHSHALGHSEFPEVCREIHQITCGGITTANCYNPTFIHGHYDSATHSIQITPYSYATAGNQDWQFNPGIHRKFNGAMKLKLTGELTQPSPIKAPVNLDLSSATGSTPIYRKQLEWSAGFFQ